METMTIGQMIKNESFEFGEAGLVHATPAKADVLAILTDLKVVGRREPVLMSMKYSTGLTSISCGDVAIWYDDVVDQLKFGMVSFHYFAAGICVTLMRPMQEQRREHTLVRCTMEDHATLLHSAKLIRAAVFAHSPTSVDVVLRPDELSA